jgi:hypothetical protein
MSLCEILANWVVAFGTLVLAAVAVFQETIRGWFYRPAFKVSIKTERPDCVKVPSTWPDGTFAANVLYLRLWIENIGNATAKNAEVYAKELRRQRVDRTWELVNGFPSMNLRWADFHTLYFQGITPDMGKHCDLGHITDPARRNLLHEDAPSLGLTNQQASLAFDVMFPPNHRGHIIGPGEYELDILVAAENMRPTKWTVTISLPGIWDADEATMLRDGVGATAVQR